MILFCLPYAGGSEAVYYDWRKYLDPSIHFMPVELKGRGRRFNEAFYKDLDDAVNDILTQIKPHITHDAYAIFGHSMGCLLAFELYYKISLENLRKPMHMFFSGQAAPCANKIRKKLYILPDREFIEEVTALGGIPKELLENKELLELIMERLRNDFRITENYTYKERGQNIECGMTVFNGKNDNITLEELLLWKSHGSNGVQIHRFSGGHFFINKNMKSVVSIINSELSKYSYRSETI